MAGIYGGYPLRHESDIKRATRSVYRKCRRLSRAKSLDRIYSKRAPNGTPYVILSLEHCHEVVKNSIRLASGRDCLVGYGRNIDLLLLAVRTSFEHGKELGRFRPVDMTVIANFIRYHTKTFRLLQEYRQHRVDVVHVSPDNVAWEKAMMAALIVWPHSPIIDP